MKKTKTDVCKPCEPDPDYFITSCVREFMIKEMEKSGKLDEMKNKIKKIMVDMNKSSK